MSWSVGAGLEGRTVAVTGANGGNWSRRDSRLRRVGALECWQPISTSLCSIS
jgi:hypothetical protein